jgi:uncharacterized protein
MSVNPLARHGGLSYLEIPALDGERSAAFYASVLGWKIDRRSDTDFRFSAGDDLLIGRWLIARAVSADGRVPFFYVDDIQHAISLCADVVEAIKPEGDILLARVRDPAGNLLGLWQFAQ